MDKPIRVIIADNDLEFSQGLKTYLDEQDNMQVINVVRDGQGTITACKEMLPDVVLIDLHLPVVDSIKTIQSVVDQNEYTKILTVSAMANDRYAIEAIKAGANGYVEKNGDLDYTEIVKAIHQIAKGEVVLTSVLAAHILQEFS